VIVDTSALIAILYEEHGWEGMRDAIIDETSILPAPAALEFVRVADLKSPELGAIARETLEQYEAVGLIVAPFESLHARTAIAANRAYGKGMRQGGKLNLLDLMVYAVARERGEPLLCTGRDFAATDCVLHPASRPQ
jgi:ribonuclease VapC